jgi:NADH:ubiquinone oxidoreductase subunit 6 (subunit J)
MAYVIPILITGLFFISASLFVFTGLTKKLLFFFFDPKWINVVIVLRMLSGFIILASAPASGAPNLMLFLGAIVIFIAFTTPFTAEEHLEKMAEWWLSLSTLTLKLWALLWMLIWFLFGYISLPENSYYTLYIDSYLHELLMLVNNYLK